MFNTNSAINRENLKHHLVNHPNILGKWDKEEYVSYNTSNPIKSWRSYEPGPTYYIAYITEKEYDLIRSHFTDCLEYAGPNKIAYWGQKTNKFIFSTKDVIVNCPLFWRVKTREPLHFLIYLTKQQSDFLIEKDIYKINLKDKPQFGPNSIPVYARGFTPIDQLVVPQPTFNPDAYSTAAGNYNSTATTTYMGFIPYTGLAYRNAFSLDSAISQPPTDIITNNTNYTTAESGIYFGSLSSQGNLVAMQLTPQLPLPAEGSTEESPKYNPWLWGYFRLYWDDPRATVFGANTAIPALTGVVPEKYNDVIPGNFVYWVDLALSRIGGINTNAPSSWNTNYFINMFNQALGYAITTNELIASTNRAEETNLPYYGSNNYADFVTNGFEIFNQGKALKKCFTNLGNIIQTVPSGSFGTSNSIAAIMIDKGLGFINDLSNKLVASNVDLNDLYNPNYTAQINAVLSSITKTSDLIIIQGVLETSVKNITSPLDYINIEKVSGQNNDSAFATLADVGKKIYSLAPNLSFENGRGLTLLLDSLVTENSEDLSISTSTSTLRPEIIECMRFFLPQNADNQTISLLNIIGTAAGYYTAELKKVNDSIAALYATPYGSQIRTALENISRIYSRTVLPNELNIPLVYDPESGTSGYGSVPEDDWTRLENQYKQQYYDLINTIANDQAADISYLVDTINTNYDYICQQLYYEIGNYNKANFATSDFGDTNTMLSFVSSLPFYGADPNNLGTDALLYGLATPNSTGSILKAILAQAKNNQIIGQSGVGIKSP